MKRTLSPDTTAFAFSPENYKWAQAEMQKYPQARSAVLPILRRAQEQNGGWLSRGAIACVAELLGEPVMRVLEVASFYSMFNFAPVGKHFVQLCGTTPCWLRGSEGLKSVCERQIGKQGEVNGDFSWTEVECLGACSNAPMVQINDTYYEDLTPERFADLLQELAEGKDVPAGPQPARTGDAPLRKGAEPFTPTAMQEKK